MAPELTVGGSAAPAYGGGNSAAPDHASAHGVGGMGCPLLNGRPADDLLVPPHGRRVEAAAPGALAGACSDTPDAVCGPMRALQRGAVRRRRPTWARARARAVSAQRAGT